MRPTRTTIANLLEACGPGWVAGSAPCAMLIGGSRAYGLARPDSDYDVTVIVAPPLHLVFPHLAGHVPGFGRKEHALDAVWAREDAGAGRSDGPRVDLKVYGLVQFLSLAAECNPNVFELLWTPDDCLLDSTPVWQTIVRNRDVFVDPGRVATKFAGYAASEMKKAIAVVPTDPVRARKHLAHTLRLCRSARQLIATRHLDQRAGPDIVAVRAGRTPLENAVHQAEEARRGLDALIVAQRPDTSGIQRVLWQALVAAYGSLDWMWGPFRNPLAPEP